MLVGFRLFFFYYNFKYNSGTNASFFYYYSVNYFFDFHQTTKDLRFNV